MTCTEYVKAELKFVMETSKPSTLGVTFENVLTKAEASNVVIVFEEADGKEGPTAFVAITVNV